MKKTFFVFTLIAALFSLRLFAQEARNALLIANGEYSSEIGKLATPIPEAEALEAVLDELGFETVIVKNADRTEIIEILDEFSTKTKNEGGIAFFHYGGHAVQHNGKNYILPVDSNISNEARLRTRAVESDEIMQSMNADTNIIILDSCRNSPFADSTRGSASRGLIATTEQPKNSVIVYSAEPGKTASDGVFTPILTQKIAEKGKSLNDILIETRNSVLVQTNGQQCPGEYNQLTKAIYLAGETAVSYDLKKTVATGSISVTSEFPGKIYIDGNYQNDISAFETVVLEDVATARYKLEIRGKEANEAQVQNIVVKRDEESQVSFKISTGNVRITSEFAGDIYLNTVKKCSIKANQPVILENLKPGNYKIEIQGKETQSRTITVTQKKVAEVSFLKTQKTKPTKKPIKNIFAVKRKKWSNSGEIQLMYSQSFFNLYDRGYFPAYGFEIDLCPISSRYGDPVSFAFEVKSGYTFASTSIGNEHFTFHEADWVCVSFGFEIMSRFSLISSAGFAATWQTFENNTTAISYKGISDPMLCLVVYPVEMKLRFGEYVSLIGKYKFIYGDYVLEPHSGWNMRHSLNIGIAINCWYGKKGV